jgi:hypothetical protein
MKPFKFFKKVNDNYFDGINFDDIVKDIVQDRILDDLPIVSNEPVTIKRCYKVTVNSYHTQIGLTNNWLHFTYILDFLGHRNVHGVRFNERDFIFNNETI